MADENRDPLSRDLLPDDVLAELAVIEQEFLISRRSNEATANGVLSMSEQTIANIAAMKLANGGVDPLLAAILNHPS